MAMYRLSASVMSRSQGRSSVAAAAYRAGVNLTNERDGLAHEYANRHGVIHTEIMLPPTAPQSFSDRETLWNAVEAAEKRKDAQLAREVQLALPHELPEAQRLALVRDFVCEQFVDQGMIADIALHAPGGEGDIRNHHAHIMLTTRDVSPDGFEGKNRSWNAKEVLEGWREAWADIQNRYLEEYSVEARVDHRTLEEQRIEQVERSEVALEQGDTEAAIEHTAKATELDREPRVYLKREDYQTAMLNRNSVQAQLLARSYALIKDAKDRAQELWSNLREVMSTALASTVSATQAFNDFFTTPLKGFKSQFVKEEPELEHGHELEGENDGQDNLERHKERDGSELEEDEPKNKDRDDYGLDFGI